MRAGNVFEGDAGGQFAPAEIILERTDQRVTARAEERYRGAAGFGNMPHQEPEMIVPQPDLTVGHVGNVNEFLEIKILRRAPARQPGPKLARKGAQFAQ